MVNDIDACKSILDRLSGRDVRLFRPPFGVVNPTVSYAVKKLGLKTVGWSIRSFDTRDYRQDDKSCSLVLDRIMRPPYVSLSIWVCPRGKTADATGLDFLEISQKAFCACIKYQILREFGFSEEWFQIIIFCNHGRNMCIATENDRHFILCGESKDFQIVRHGK